MLTLEVTNKRRTVGSGHMVRAVLASILACSVALSAGAALRAGDFVSLSGVESLEDTAEPHADAPQASLLSASIPTAVAVIRSVRETVHISEFSPLRESAEPDEIGRARKPQSRRTHSLGAAAAGISLTLLFRKPRF